MPDFAFNKAKAELARGNIDNVADDIRVLLLKSSTPDQDLDFVVDLVPATNEVTVSGYARQVLGSKVVTEDDTLDRADIDAGKAVFASLAAGETITWAIVFKFITNDAASILLYAFDVADTATNGGTFEVRWNGVDGVGTLVRVT